jgi:hypothetical protein
VKNGIADELEAAKTNAADRIGVPKPLNSPVLEDIKAPR